MRWTMLPPILPRPTKPSCMFRYSLSGSRSHRRGRRRGGARAPRGRGGSTADARGGQAVRPQGLQVAVGLGVDERAEGVGLAGHLEVVRGVVDELEEAP